MTAQEETQQELKKSDSQYEETKLGLANEFAYIGIRIFIVLLFSFGFFYGIAFLVTFRSGGWTEMRELILLSSFIIGGISFALLVMRMRAGMGTFQASASRSAWTGKKMEDGAFPFFRDLTFGFKLDTLIAFGTAAVFIITYIFS